MSDNITTDNYSPSYKSTDLSERLERPKDSILSIRINGFPPRKIADFYFHVSGHVKGPSPTDQIHQGPKDLVRQAKSARVAT